MLQSLGQARSLTLAGFTVALAISAGSLAAQSSTVVGKVKVSEDKPGLLKKAKIAADSAVAIARATVPGGTISGAEIEEEDGALIYSFDIKVAGKKGVEEIHVDAVSGKVLTREHEEPASEKAEAARETAEKAARKTPPVTRKPPI
ncbi:MAG: PepSY domain-containing protein [Gemmatimonadaceae bacterium]|nr:PepSY domain-containing protein [Gemmatimonadaceae bacterium]